ncbi:MAG: nickel pincer cofactor biosynthesis protein LarC [Chloroflexi bacterium]|nr:nickel pincer cofactor biosynthesis protein LarC [Chloroflexota bacterium]
MTLAYFDCFSGVSGDMTLGALLDAGLPLDVLRRELAKLGLEGYEVEAEAVKVNGLRGTRAQVRLSKNETGTTSTHRHLPDIVAILESSALSSAVVEKARSVFLRLAEAEGRVHGISANEVHFHEAGALDAIVDVVGSVIGLEQLGVDQIFASPLPLGRGFVRCEHGVLPVPAPATLELLKDVGAPVAPSEAEVELVTPTGAAIMTTLARFTQPPMTIERIGYGFGQRELAWPNALRIWLGQAVAEPCQEMSSFPAENDTIILLETNIDDMSPEVYGYLMERLFDAGALDVYFTPIYMKKNRPATMVSVLGPVEAQDRLSEIILSETTTLGIRVSAVGRHKSHRDSHSVQTKYGEVRVKLKQRGDEVLDVAPEYEDCAAIARREDLPLQRVFATVRAEALKQLATHGSKAE